MKKRAEDEKGEDEGARGERKNGDENGAAVGGEEEGERGGEWVRKEGRVPLILSDLGVLFLAEVGLCFPRLESEGPAGSPADLGFS